MHILSVFGDETPTTTLLSRQPSVDMGVTPSVKASVTGLNYCQETGAVVVGTDKGVMVMDTVIGHPHVKDLQAALFPICNKGKFNIILYQFENFTIVIFFNYL